MFELKTLLDAMQVHRLYAQGAEFQFNFALNWFDQTMIYRFPFISEPATIIFVSLESFFWHSVHFEMIMLTATAVRLKHRFNIDSYACGLSL